MRYLRSGIFVVATVLIIAFLFSGCLCGALEELFIEDCKDDACMETAFYECVPRKGTYKTWDVEVIGKHLYEESFMKITTKTHEFCQVDFGEEICLAPEAFYKNHALWELKFLSGNCFSSNPPGTLPVGFHTGPFPISCNRDATCEELCLDACVDSIQDMEPYFWIKMGPTTSNGKSVCKVEFSTAMEDETGLTDKKCYIPIELVGDFSNMREVYDSEYCEAPGPAFTITYDGKTFTSHAEFMEYWRSKA